MRPKAPRLAYTDAPCLGCTPCCRRRHRTDVNPVFRVRVEPGAASGIAQFGEADGRCPGGEFKTRFASEGIGLGNSLADRGLRTLIRIMTKNCLEAPEAGFVGLRPVSDDLLSNRRDIGLTEVYA